MHKLMEYICEELEELERKADKDGKLSMAEIQYGDTLAHFKKNLLSAEEMWDNSEYSEAGGSYARGRGGNRGGRNRGGANQYGSYAMRGGSYVRGNRDGYSGDDSEMMVQELRELMEQAPDDRTRTEFHKFIKRIEQM